MGSRARARGACRTCKSHRRGRRPSPIRAASLHRAQESDSGGHRSSQVVLRTCVRCKQRPPGDQPATVLASSARVGRLLASNARSERAPLAPTSARPLMRPTARRSRRSGPPVGPPARILTCGSRWAADSSTRSTSIDDRGGHLPSRAFSSGIQLATIRDSGAGGVHRASPDRLDLCGPPGAPFALARLADLESLKRSTLETPSGGGPLP